MIKGSIQEDITIVNIYASNIRSLKHVKQILIEIKGEIYINPVIVGNFNTPLTSMDRSSRQKINKETLALNDTIRRDRLNIYRILHPKAAEYTFKCKWNILQDRSHARPQNKSF